MKNKNFIRLNIDDNYLSLGNIFRIIKETSINPNSFWQSDLFCIIFNCDYIADSTVNNYCTGFRAINSKYKNYFYNLKTRYEKDESIFISIIGNIINLLYTGKTNIKKYSLKQINNDIKLKKVCTKLFSISKNDNDVKNVLLNKLYQYLNSDNLYCFIIEILSYSILEKKQPIYKEDNFNSIMEKSLYSTNISIQNVEQFVKIQLDAGIWSLRSINELAKQKNPFACFEMASLEFYGIIAGYPRYEKAYEYYKIASDYNHPVANWAIGYLYYKGYIGFRTTHDLYMAFRFFNKSRKYNCSSAFNSLGLVFLNGDIPHIKKSNDNAMKMFEKSALLGNVYAYNNIGRIYENNNKYKEAFENYNISANLGDSWALNKVGEFYRMGKYVKKDLKKAYQFCTSSSECFKYSCCPWSKYNLAKYFYINGNIEINVNKDINKAIELLNEVCENLIEALEELIIIYYKLYIESSRENIEYYNKIKYYIKKVENHPRYNLQVKKRVEEYLNKIDVKKIKFSF